MNPLRIVWKAQQIINKTDDKIGRNLDRIGVFLQSEIVQSFGSPEAPGAGGPKTPTGRKTSARIFRQSQHSEPGEPPFVQTGSLRRSITFERVGARKLLVGSSLQAQDGGSHSYAWYLEMGSPAGQLAARPYLRPALRNNKPEIRRMLVKG